LTDAISIARAALILPADDLAAFHLHELYRRQEQCSPLATLIERSLGSPEFFSIVHSRAAFIKLADEEGIRVPKTQILRTADQLKAWVEREGLPSVLKADGTSGGEGVRVARTVEEAQRAFQQLQKPPLLARACKRALFDQDRTLIWPSLRRHRPTMNAQVFVAGHEATSTIACWKGTVLASLHFEVLRKCSEAGHATVVRLIENAEMSSAVEKIVRRMGLSGICGFDFMLEANTGNAFLIEINPRATQVGHLTLGPGRDLPAAIYGAVSGDSARIAAAVTDNDTVALFPHEWARDSQSEFLRTGYHDVPWEAPELVNACIQRGRQQSAWYSRDEVSRKLAVGCSPAKTPSERRTAAGIAAR
jgi:acetyl/propionyl-CoA carboxylase alpha subunit